MSLLDTTIAAPPGLMGRVACDVQVLVAPGNLAFAMVGLADKAVGESRERIRAALRAMGLALPPERTVLSLQARHLMDPDTRAAVQAVLGNLPSTAQPPVILTDHDIRPFVFKILNPYVSDLTVLSYNQISPQIRLQHLAYINAQQR